MVSLPFKKAIIFFFSRESIMEYVSNAFSLGMVPRELLSSMTCQACTKPDLSRLHSVVGHQDIANILGVKFNRVSTRLESGDVLYVAQYYGERLPEGVTVLPEGAVIDWVKVSVG
jgi:hypothetical protein